MPKNVLISEFLTFCPHAKEVSGSCIATLELFSSPYNISFFKELSKGVALRQFLEMLIEISVVRISLSEKRNKIIL